MTEFAVATALAAALGCTSGSSGLHPTPSDASAEAASPEASADAVPSTDASPWCDRQGFHLFCDDFDEGILTEGWDGVDQQHGLGTLDSAAYTSPPRSFLASTTALTDGAVAGIRLGKSVVDTVAGLELAFDVRADAVDPSGARAVASEIQLLDPLGEVLETVDVTFSVNGVTVDDHAVAADGGVDFSSSHPISTGSPVGKWMRVDIHVDFPSDGSVGGGALSVATGESAKLVVDHAAMSPGSHRAQPFLLLGIVSARGPAEPTALRFDDLTFSAHE